MAASRRTSREAKGSAQVPGCKKEGRPFRSTYFLAPRFLGSTHFLALRFLALGWFRPPWNKKKDRPSVLDAERLMQRHREQIQRLLSKWARDEGNTEEHAA